MSAANKSFPFLKEMANFSLHKRILLRQHHIKEAEKKAFLIYSKTHAFTLLEILIVFIIIGILSSLTIPSYQKYITKAKLLDAFNFVNSIKIAASEFYLENNIWPNNKNINLESNNIQHKYIKKIILIPNNSHNESFLDINLTFTGEKSFENKMITLKGYQNNYNISWECISSNINQLDNALLPKECVIK